MDYHAYEFPGKTDASGNTTAYNLQQITSRASLPVAITETNFPVNAANGPASWADRWKQRGMGLADQTMALLRNPDKVLTRQVFDWKAEGSQGSYRFLPDVWPGGKWTPEMELYRVFGNVSGATRLTVKKESPLLQTEAVCVASASSGQCVHAQVFLMNAGGEAVAQTVSLDSMAKQCAAATGSVVRLGPGKEGPQRRSAVGCTSASLAVPAYGIAMLECAC